ncbi:MAG: site-specific integrase [Gammaproteobacteria bacterium]|nr:site-specific integrase [Gammaproteobacteria bacterium]
MERDVFPAIGTNPISTLNAADLLPVLRRIEARGANEVARRVRQAFGQIFRYAIASGRATRDPAADLRDALEHTKETHRAALTKPKEVGALLRAIQGFQGEPTTRAALQLAPLTFVRPGELRAAEWAEFDLPSATWRIPSARMKMREEHIVPLSHQAVSILRELQQFTDRKEAKYLFPSVRTRARCMSENTVNAALRRLGYTKDEMTGHGFRSIASTLLHEHGHWTSEIIERQLAHGERNKVKAAYNRAQHLAERRKMMQWWSDYLDALRDGAEIVPLHKKA